MRFFVFIILLSGCGSLHRSYEFLQDPSLRQINHQTPKLYAEATQALENEKFEEAKLLYEKFLVREPTTPYSQLAHFNLARSFFGLKMYADSVDQLRLVATQTSGHAPELQAQAFYQLSFSYEALGDRINALASLLDSYQRKQYFSREVATAEIPARIAGAFAALGNFEQARVYYTQAEDGVRLLKREIQNNKIPEWLPRTLYYMGEVSLRKMAFEDVASVLRPLAKAQVYLLEASEIGETGWSQKSSQELINTYARTLDVIAKSRLLKNEEDPISAARLAQEKQWELAQEFYRVLDEMKIYERPDLPNQNLLTRQIFASVAKTKEKVMKILNQAKIGQEVTDSSKAHQHHLQGKVVKPNSILEQDYIEQHKVTKPTVDESKKSPVSIEKKDPNL